MSYFACKRYQELSKVETEFLTWSCVEGFLLASSLVVRQLSPENKNGSEDVMRISGFLCSIQVDQTLALTATYCADVP